MQDGDDAEPSLAAPENHARSQVTWLRGSDADRESEAPATVLPEVAIVSPMPRVRPAACMAAQLRQSSMFAAAAVALIDLAGVR